MSGDLFRDSHLSFFAERPVTLLMHLRYVHGIVDSGKSHSQFLDDHARFHQPVATPEPAPSKEDDLRPHLAQGHAYMPSASADFTSLLRWHDSKHPASIDHAASFHPADTPSPKENSMNDLPYPSATDLADHIRRYHGAGVRTQAQHDEAHDLPGGWSIFNPHAHLPAPSKENSMNEFQSKVFAYLTEGGSRHERSQALRHLIEKRFFVPEESAVESKARFKQFLDAWRKEQTFCYGGLDRAEAHFFPKPSRLEVTLLIDVESLPARARRFGQAKAEDAGLVLGLVRHLANTDVNGFKLGKVSWVDYNASPATEHSASRTSA